MFVAEHYRIAAESNLCDASTLCGYALFVAKSNRALARQLMERARNRDTSNDCVRTHASSVLK